MKAKLSIIIVLSMLITALCPHFVYSSSAVYKVTFVCSTTRDGKLTSISYDSLTSNFPIPINGNIYVMKSGDTCLNNRTVEGYSSINGNLLFTDNYVITNTIGSSMLLETGVNTYEDNGITYVQTYYLLNWSKNYVTGIDSDIQLLNDVLVEDGVYIPASATGSRPNAFTVLSPVNHSNINDVNTNMTWRLKGYDGYKVVIRYYTSVDGSSWSYAGLITKYLNETFTITDGMDWNNYTLYSNEIPWQNGYLKFEFAFYHPTIGLPALPENTYNVIYNVNCQKSYVRIIKPSSNSVEIPLLKVEKHNYPAVVDVYINGVYYLTMKESNLAKTILPKSTDCQIGTNYITVKDKNTNAEIVTDTFILNANNDGEIEPNVNETINEDGQKVDSSGKPIKPTGGNIIEWIIYGFNYVGWTLVSLGSSISSLVTSTMGFGTLISEWFSFMPTEIKALISAGIALLIILRIFGR